MKKPILSELTLEEKIGQMLLGYQWDINRKSEVDPKILRTDKERNEVLNREKFGTLWAQTGHIAKANDMNEDAHKTDNESAEFGRWIKWESDQYKIPALTALDAEGQGAGPLFSDLTITCNPFTVAATNSEELSFKLGEAVAKELRCAGVTWRWAPTVDVASRFNAVSYGRSFFPDDPEKEIKTAVAHINGMQSQGVAATAKHFPGGDYLEYRDPHYCAAKISTSKEDWWKEQGKIFQGVIDGGVYAVMISHTAFPAVDDRKIDGTYIPSTISDKIITDLLKTEMNFKGVVVTDLICMASLNTLFPYDELIIRLVNAGNDVILGVKPNTGEIIKKAVEEGKVDISRIDDAVSRILDMKEKLGMFEEGYSHIKGISQEIAPETQKINMEIARKGITLVRDRQNLIPIDKNKIKNVKIICSTHTDDFFTSLDILKDEFEKRGATVSMQRRLSGYDEIVTLSEEFDLIIYAGYLSSHQPVGGVSFFGDEAKTFFYANSSGKEKSIGVSFGYPHIHYDFMETANTYINAYGKSPELIKAFVEGIYGEIPFVGKSPVDIENYNITRR